MKAKFITAEGFFGYMNVSRRKPPPVVEFQIIPKMSAANKDDNCTVDPVCKIRRYRLEKFDAAERQFIYREEVI